MDTTIVYLVSFISMYVIVTIAILIRFRGLLTDEYRKKFLIRKGYCYIEINGDDKQRREYFMKPKDGQVEIKGCVYFTQPDKNKFKGAAIVYEFREGISEPIDVYNENVIGTDAKFLDAWMFKMKSLARVTAAKEMQMLLYVAGGAAIAALVAAVIAYTNYNGIQELLKFLIK